MFRPVPLSRPTEGQDFVGVSLSPRDKTHSFLGPLTSATAVTGPHPVPRRCPERPTTARCIGPGRRRLGVAPGPHRCRASSHAHFLAFLFEISSLLTLVSFFTGELGALNPAHGGPFLLILDHVALDGLAAVVQDQEVSRCCIDACAHIQCPSVCTLASRRCFYVVPVIDVLFGEEFRVWADGA